MSSATPFPRRLRKKEWGAGRENRRKKELSCLQSRHWCWKTTPSPAAMKSSHNSITASREPGPVAVPARIKSKLSLVTPTSEKEEVLLWVFAGPPCQAHFHWLATFPLSSKRAAKCVVQSTDCGARPPGSRVTLPLAVWSWACWSICLYLSFL